ncbi:MAG TPA: MFS transporter [Candidatus Cybelea sp.]|nr:MFS transporter [Candidatus Cybelea sp.]
MIAIGIGTAVVPLDTSVNIAFPSITRAFDLTAGDMQWVVICFVLTYASLMLVLGHVGDLFGHAAVLRAGLLWSIAALVLCAIAPSFAALLACRILQGIGAALILSCGAALMTSLYDEARRSRVLGFYVMIFGLSSTLGPWFGGALLQLSGWQAIFWYRVPVAAAALVLMRGFPSPSPTGRRERLDVAGAALLVLAVGAMLLAFNRVHDWTAVPLFGLSITAFAAFAWQELRADKPVLDLRVFRLRGFAAINLVSILVNLAAFSVWLLVPFYLAKLDTFSLLAAGGILSMGAAGTVIASPIAGLAVGRIAAERLALAGAAMVSIGLATIGTWTNGTATYWLVGTLVLQGLGLGLFQLAYTDVVTASLPVRDRGVAGSLALVTRTLGTVGAAAIVFLVFQALETTEGFYAAFQHTFQSVALLALAAAVVLAFGRGIRRAARTT